MIYLFCNLGYGENFISALKKYSEKNNIKSILIMSPKNKKRTYGFISKKYNELLLSRRTGLQVKLVYDVNGIDFNKKIQTNDIAIVAGFNQIFTKNTIERFKLIVNFHPSLLPYYRGPVPSYWCIKNKERETGYTLHKLTEDIDDGEILFQEVIQVERNITEQVLDKKIAKKAAITFTMFINYLCNKGIWKNTQVDVEKIYKTKVNYLSFPTKDDV